jgi:hypothetical protein
MTSPHDIPLKRNKINVPRENILDLRAVLQAREEEKKRKAEAESDKRWAKIFRTSGVGGADPRRNPQRIKAYQEREKALEDFFHIEEASAPESIPPEKGVLLLQQPEPPETIRERTTAARTPILSSETVRIWVIRAGATVGFAVVVFGLFLGGGAWYSQALAVKERVMGISTTAVDSLDTARVHLSSFDFEHAATDFHTAQEAFQLALDEMNEIHRVVAWIPVKGGEVRSAEALLQAGVHLANAGTLATDAAQSLSAIRPGSVKGLEEGLNLTDGILLASAQVEPALTHLKLATIYLDRVQLKHIPEHYQATLETAKSQLPQLVAEMEQLQTVTDAVLGILGHERPQKYLLLFQNNDELRATGGFPGSMAVLKMDRGRLEELEIPGGGIYDVAGQVSQRVIAPQPMHVVNPHWNIQDANWHPHFPDSAKRILAFYENGGGESLDGVLAITPNLVEALLKLTGPLELGAPYDTTVTSENLVALTQAESEKKPEETTQPKAVIAALAPLLLNRVFELDPSVYPMLFETFSDALDHQDLLMYFVDPSRQQFVQTWDWSGAVKSVEGDYLMVVRQNIGGGKSDKKIEALIQHEAAIQPDGRILDTITLTMTHRGVEGEALSGVMNNTYVRFYVPAGSRLVSAEGFDTVNPDLFLAPDRSAVTDPMLKAVQGEVSVDEYSGTRTNLESGKTVFGNWIVTGTGVTSRATIRYELPFRLDVGRWRHPAETYHWMAQRQPGTEQTVLEHSVTTSVPFHIRWAEPQEQQQASSEMSRSWTWPFDDDRQSAVIVERSE